MAFILPTFNVSCGIWRFVSGSWTLLQTLDVNLSPGRLVSVENQIDVMLVRFPPHTDVTDGFNSGADDRLEIPAGSGRWYAASFVDDIGKGFANEHRFASARKAINPITGSNWPIPIP